MFSAEEQSGRGYSGDTDSLMNLWYLKNGSFFKHDANYSVLLAKKEFLISFYIPIYGTDFPL